ncbi:MAG: exo-alpha-sialidase, partial [Opitutae bacterium]|nr:exo-alpha-sialidase [Opitutae bacterium]
MNQSRLDRLSFSRPCPKISGRGFSRVAAAVALFWGLAVPSALAQTTNHAPVGTSNTVTMLEDTPYAFSVADFGFTDPNDSPPNILAAVKITTLPAAGTLTSGGSAVTNGQRVPYIIGATWTPRQGFGNWWAVASSADGTKLVAAAYGGQLYTSTDSGATWTARESNRDWWAVASSADGTRLVAAENGGRLYTSTDSGATWTPRENIRDWASVASSADGTKLVAAQAGGWLFTSTNSGETWTLRATNRFWRAVASSADGTKLVTGVYGGQIYTSTDSGATWTARETDRDWMAVASSADGTKLVAAVENGQLYTSTDSGATWTARATTHDWLAVASSADGTGLVAVADQIYTSTDSGATWTASANIRNSTGVASSADGTKLVAVVYGGYIYTSQGGLDLTFTPAANAYGSPYASFTFQVQDDGGTANGGVDLDPTPKTMTLNVTAVPENQMIDFPAIGDKSTTVSVGLSATASSGLPVFFDVDSGPAIITGLTNLSFTGTGTVSIVASQAGNGDWNAAPNVTNTFNVTVANHAPAGTSNTVTLAEDTPYAFSAADFGFTDPDDSPVNGFVAVKITTLPGAGTLSSGGSAVTNGQWIGLRAGVSWTARETTQPWSSVASSADGTKLVAAAYGGYLYTSTDSGASWTARDSDRNWSSVASSADGTKLVAGVFGGPLYTSTDSGATWTARETSRNWQSVASSADGTKLVAAVGYGGQL